MDDKVRILVRVWGVRFTKNTGYTWSGWTTDLIRAGVPEEYAKIMIGLLRGWLDKVF